MNKPNRKKLRTLILAIIVLSAIGIAGATYRITKAELTPDGNHESGATSRIKELYDYLVDASFGSDTDSPDWGSYWNRIKTAAKWVPNGNAAVGDVITGKTFYNGNRTVKTGTYPNPTQCPAQTQTDNVAEAQANNCVLSWTDPVVAGNQALTDAIDKQDPRTGLQWSHYLYKNASGDILFKNNTSLPFTYDSGVGGSNNPAGKTGAQLCTDRGNGWRLPTEKEVMQAYVDGMNYHLTQAAQFIMTSTLFDGNITDILAVSTSRGIVSNGSKGTGYRIRCVRMP